ncbi:MAG: ferric reductase-like transmembrane domain-containing protein [Bacillus sp. (in: firmicutes)]
MNSDFFDLLSTWNLIRVSGFLSYFLLTFAIAAGLMNRLLCFQKQKPLMIELHKISGWTGMLTIIFHISLLLVDEYVPYSISDIVIPFSADNDPVFSGMGTISLYLFLVTFATSDFLMKKLGRTLWKKIHFLVIPAWILMVLHGIFIGTDTSQTWAAFVYVGSIILIMLLLTFRYLESQLGSTKRKNASF